MRHPQKHPAPDERGFILVGVVTFMLALTILGLSLFALSSYEAQFFMASVAREQSLQNSESGMELVKASLAAPNSRLEDAHRAEGQLGITRAMAYQWRSDLATDTTSQGPVNWDSTVVIVVAAKSGGVERSLQARFIPGPVEDPYKRLLAAGLGVSVNTKNSSNPDRVQLSGRVWQPVASDADTSWTGYADWNTGRPIERGAPPAPMADAFVDDLLSAPTEDPSPGTNLSDEEDYEMRFVQVSPTSPTVFHSPPSPNDHHHDEDPQYATYSFYVGANLDIKVQGTVVWVVQQGVCFDDRVTVDVVNSNVPSTLVIVAKANASENRGLWFKGGLDVKGGVRVYLVTQGDVSLVHIHDNEETHSAPAVSIVAGGRIEIGGPKDSDTFTLTYDPATMDALADQLLAQGALPPVMGGTGANFTVARQTWVETTPQ